MLTTLDRSQGMVEPWVHAWTKDEYYRMADIGLFDGKRVELIEGVVIEMSPMKSVHAAGVTLVHEVLRQVFSEGCFIRAQLPLNLGGISEPEPDIAVIQGQVRDFTDAHPTEAVLIVEVADTSLCFDRTEKASLYAKAGIPDYWILNLIDRRLEVQRDPQPDASQPFNFGYATQFKVDESGMIPPLAAPQDLCAVSDLLP